MTIQNAFKPKPYLPVTVLLTIILSCLLWHTFSYSYPYILAHCLNQLISYYYLQLVKHMESMKFLHRFLLLIVSPLFNLLTFFRASTLWFSIPFSLLPEDSNQISLNDSLPFSEVWPNHFHFPSLMFFFLGGGWFISSMFSFVITSGHLFFRDFSQAPLYKML